MTFSKRFKALTTALFAFVLSVQPFGAVSAYSAEAEYDAINSLLALNMAVVSVKTVVSTQDRVVLDQEYRNIINNLRLGEIADDLDMKSLYTELMNVITGNTLRAEEAKRFQDKYDRRQKNAIVGALAGIRPYGGNMWSFLGSLFTQGVSAYFGYRDAKNQMSEELDDSLWQLKKEAIEDFNDLQVKLLDASWSLLRQYHLPDDYRITQEDLDLLEYGLAETDKENAVQIFRELERKFAAYPPFWFYYGDAAYKCGDTKTALKCFDEFDKVWRKVLRQDPYKVQIAKYRLMLEQNPPKERVVALLKDIKDNSGPREWLDNLFYGAVSFSVGEKDKAIRAVNNNILFKAETEISPVVLASMKSGKLNMSRLPKDIAAAVKNVQQEEVKKADAPQGNDVVTALKALFDGDDATANRIAKAMIDDNSDNPIPYLIYSTSLQLGRGGMIDFPYADELRRKHDTLVEKSQDAYTAVLSLCEEQAKAGKAVAENLLGLMYSQGWAVKADKAKAAEWYSKAANKGYAVAQANLGYMYLAGEGVKKSDETAVRWFRKATEKEYAFAQVYLGKCYDEGWGVAKDSSEAAQWYRKAAEQGLAVAQNNLAVSLWNTQEQEKCQESVNWFKKAAEQGESNSQYVLGMFYYHGSWGMPQDHAEAAKWFEKSADQGNEDAKGMLKLAKWSGVLDDEDIRYYNNSTGSFIVDPSWDYFTLRPAWNNKKWLCHNKWLIFDEK